MRKNTKFRTLIAFITAMCFSFNTYAVSPIVVNSLYNYAKTKQVTKIRYMVKNMGYDIDVEDDDGNTAWCIAKEKDDTCAMSVLEQLGADPQQRCGLPWGWIGAAAGVAAVGGIAAGLGGGGGGGSDTPDQCKGVVCGENQHCEKGECVCNSGFLYSQTDGVCYIDLHCSEQPHSTGTQILDRCECKNGFWGGRFCDVCTGFEGSDGNCYERLNCWHGGSQENDHCNCDSANGWTGSSCNECNGVIGSNDVCYPDLGCEHGGKQVDGRCDCTVTNGYEGERCEICNGWDQNNTCWEKLNCGQENNRGHQENNTCVCDNGWDGENSGCNTCNGVVGLDGVCYPEQQCNEPHGNQVNGSCECDTANGYTGPECKDCANGYGHYGSPTECYPELDCGEHGSQSFGSCQCDTGWAGALCDVCDTANGYYEQNGTCYKDLHCESQVGSTGVQTDNYCECYEGYTGQLCNSCENGYANHYGAPYCYANIDCGINGYQYQEECRCLNGWEGEFCNECPNGRQGADGICYPELDCTNGHQNGNTCICNEGYARDGNGLCVDIGTATTEYAIRENNNNLPPEDKVVTKTTYGDLIGKQYISDQDHGSDSILGDPDDLYVHMLMNEDYSTKHDQNLKLEIRQYSDGNVYGVQSPDARDMYVSYLWLMNSVEEESTQSTEITIINGKTYNKDGFTMQTGGNGDAFGIYAPGKFWEDNTPTNIYNIAKNIFDDVEYDYNLLSTIKVTSFGSGQSYGMYNEYGNINNGIYIVSGQDKNGNIIDGTNENTNNAVVDVENTGTGNAYGLYAASNGNITNSGVVNVKTNSGLAIGLYSNGGYIVNTNKVNVSSTSGIAIGIYANGGSVTNSGTITVDGVDGDSYGIYAKNGATVTNTGTIKLNGNTYTGTGQDGYGDHVVIDGSATYANFGLMSADFDVNFDDVEGTTVLGKGGAFKANSLSGTLNIDSSVVANGFADKYVEKQALQSANVDVNTVSNSAMFEASVEQDEATKNANVVMTRKSFNDISASSSIAEFLEKNYKAQNNSLLFENLKKADAATYTNTEAKALGYGLIPNFAHENMRVIRNLNTVLTDELLASTENERQIVGYDHLYQGRDTKGTLTGYENHANTMYLMFDKEQDNLIRTGVGLSITQFSSDYDDDSSRKDIMVQALVPVSYIGNNGVGYAAIARLGYSDGEYERYGINGKFESDLTSWVYGLSNTVKYKMDLGYVVIEPAAEFNILGYYQNRIRENKNKQNAIKADAENNLSVEAGVGINVRKDVKINDNSKLSFNASAMYYHEFAHPYHSLDASLHGMSYTYRIKDYENIYNRDRGVISAGIDYSYKPFTFYGKAKAFIEDKTPFETSAGVKYNF